MVGGGALDRWAAEQGASMVVGVVVIVCVCVFMHTRMHMGGVVYGFYHTPPRLP